MEEQKLQEIEKLAFHDFRQDLLNRLRKQSARATAIKDTLGLGYRPAHVRSRSSGNPSIISAMPSYIASQTVPEQAAYGKCQCACISLNKPRSTLGLAFANLCVGIFHSISLHLILY